MEKDDRTWESQINQSRGRSHLFSFIWLTLDNEAFGRLLHAPYDNRSIQASGSYKARVGTPGDAIDFGSVVAPYFFAGHLQQTSNNRVNTTIGILGNTVNLNKWSDIEKISSDQDLMVDQFKSNPMASSDIVQSYFDSMGWQSNFQFRLTQPCCCPFQGSEWNYYLDHFRLLPRIRAIDKGSPSGWRRQQQGTGCRAKRHNQWLGRRVPAPCVGWGYRRAKRTRVPTRSNKNENSKNCKFVNMFYFVILFESTLWSVVPPIATSGWWPLIEAHDGSKLTLKFDTWRPSWITAIYVTWKFQISKP